jgi:glycosyltransferase involved in cell wall biosynthesis
MARPAVSIVVPCYNLSHLLAECVNSILSQSYSDLEVVIMDDCSPDDTAEVARSFRDPRVKYIRNEPNLGHLRNYNKGIVLSEGKYVWLISADDYLRRPYVLQRYVELLEKNPNVGYAFCDGVRVKDLTETGSSTLSSWFHGERDRVIDGHVFLKTLLKSNSVPAASGMARRECYERIGMFPLDMPWAGDWYLWCIYALHFDVAYFAEPMVCIRVHELSMTTKLTREKLDACAAEEISIPWLIMEKAQAAGHMEVARECLRGVAHTYVRTIASELYRRSSLFMNLEQFEASLLRNTTTKAERNWVRARVYAGVGNECYWRNELVLARKFYQAALKEDPSMTSVHIKKLLLSLGRPGDYIRKTLYNAQH